MASGMRSSVTSPTGRFREPPARHRAAAAWVERHAGDRVEDLADVLAHHYLSAPSLARAAGQTVEITALETSAVRYLTLAGERALGLDAAQAELRLARALELCPVGDPVRPELLLRWGQAAFQVGRLRAASPGPHPASWTGSSRRRALSRRLT